MRKRKVPVMTSDEEAEAFLDQEARVGRRLDLDEGRVRFEDEQVQPRFLRPQQPGRRLAVEADDRLGRERPLVLEAHEVHGVARLLLERARVADADRDRLQVGWRGWVVSTPKHPRF